MYKLQDVLLAPVIGNEETILLYYRTEDYRNIVENLEKASEIQKNVYIDFFTYFGSLSAEKWKKYSYAHDFYLVLDVCGDFCLNLFGHYIENFVIKKETLGSYHYRFQERTRITVPYPRAFKSQVVAFAIQSNSKLKVYGISYVADIEENNYSDVFISLCTTTYKKEEYIFNNLTKFRNELINDAEFEKGFFWHIVDNGCTLEEINDSHVSITHNKNMGGAGGFAKGMIESLHQLEKPTHILLMDDDVDFSVESFRRVYRLLRILRPEYRGYFISGAMINMDASVIQHESTATLEEGYCKPLHCGRNLTLWDQILWNEQIDDTIENRYAAWWYCCIPATVVREDNLPLPIFVRGDDMEYSIRNHAKFITMNGISIWHMSFGGKYNATMECYQAKRNELIVFSIREELSVDNSFSKIEEQFWQNLYKFDYVSAGFLADAVEDFLKGPEWFFAADLYDEISKRRKLDNKKRKITDNVRAKIDYGKLFVKEDAPRGLKFIYDYTYNGQARIPQILCHGGIGVIPYNGDYFPQKQMLTSKNYAIDVINDQYVELKKDLERFKMLKKRWGALKKEYIEQKEYLAERYRNCAKEATSIAHWEEILNS